MLLYLVWTIYLIVLFISFFLLIIFLEEGGIKHEINWRDKWPSLTLVLPAYNEEETIGMTIESALDVDYPEDKYEIIVVNDGSTDNTKEEAEKYTDHENVTLINQKNQGKGAALNTGLENSNAEYFGCVDADSYLTENSLKNILSEIDDNAGGIASAMKVYKPQNLWQKLQWVEYIVGIFIRNLMEKINAIHVTPGPLSIYDREIIEEIGGFDEDSLVEDQEICFRLQEHDYKVNHSRLGEVFTVAPKNFKEFYNQRLRWYKGAIENILQYNNMMFNPRYGEFGVFAIPIKLGQGLLSIAGLAIISYYFLQPIFNILRETYIMGLSGIIATIEQTTLSNILNTVYWFLISLETMTITLLGTLIAFSLFLLYVSAIHTEDNPLEQGYIAPFIYMFWYFIIVGFMWLISLISLILDIILNREKRWT